MKYSMLAVILASLLSGCVSTKNVPISQSDLQSMKNDSITSTAREKPGFSAMTAGKAAFGAFGAAAMISAGNKIIKENDVADPAVYIAESLLSDLENKLGANIKDSSAIKVDGEKVNQIAQLYSEFPYVLDIRTINWSFIYFPTDWNNYRVIYSAKLRLIDTDDNKVLSEGFCSRVPEKTDDAPSKAELLDNQAEGLKKELKIAADFCVEEFRKNLLIL